MNDKGNEFALRVLDLEINVKVGGFTA